MTPQKTVQNLATLVKKEGGRLFVVGGCVRDKLMGLVPKDIDCEVYHLFPEKLREVISQFGKVDAVGASFQVYKVGQDIDVSLPRRERKTGEGHKGFTVEGDPNMSFEEACSRRDFTINAIMEDPLTGEIVDPFGGVVDIDAKMLRLVAPNAFQEDSLRVLRLAQFASRLGFGITNDARILARSTDLSDLPKERVWMELEKMFLKSPRPSVGVNALRELLVIEKLFPSFQQLTGMNAFLDNAVGHCEELSEGEKLSVLVSIFTWASSERMLDEIGLSAVNGYNVRKNVEELHTHSYRYPKTDYEYHKLSQDVSMKLLSKIIHAFGSPNAEVFERDVARLGIAEKPVEPILKGRDLIDLGMEASPAFGKILAEAYEEQIKGNITNSEEARQFASSKLL